MKKHLLFLPGLWKKLEIGCCFCVRTLTLCRAHEGSSAADCRARSRSARSATKSGRQKIPTFCSAAPGTVAPLPACPRTEALRLALCPCLSRVSPFTVVLTRAHLPAFHSHLLTAHNTGTAFLNFFL